MARMPFSGFRFLMQTASQAYSKQGGDLDVDATLQGFLRLLHQRGGVHALSAGSAGFIETIRRLAFDYQTANLLAKPWLMRRAPGRESSEG